MSFTVSISDLRKAATAIDGNLSKWALACIDKAERALWERKFKPGATFPLPLLKEAVDVEFALWALPVSASSNPNVDIDVVGRKIACSITGPVFDEWLLEAGELTNYRIGSGYVIDLFLDIVEKRRPLADWHGWLFEVESMKEGITAHCYESAVKFAALSSARSLLVPDTVSRLPGKRKVDAYGRHCAYAAYFNACYAWATGNEGYRAAYAIADIAAEYADDDALASIDTHLDRLHTSLIVESSDAAVRPYANEAFRRFVEVGL